MPDISEIFKNWAQVIAIFIGGVWAVCRWIYEARANAPSLDGELTVERSALSNTSDVVTVRALWNNRCKFALKLNEQKCSVSAYKVAENLPAGNLDNDKLGMPLHSQYVFSKPTILEPKSESTLRAHFVLEQGPVYLFRWELTSCTRRKWTFFQRVEYSWSKETIWNSSPKTLPQQ